MTNFINVFLFFFRKDYLWLPLFILYNHNNNNIKKLSLFLLSSSEMQRMFLTVSNFPVRETGSKTALYFIHNDTRNQVTPKYFDDSKKKL